MDVTFVAPTPTGVRPGTSDAADEIVKYCSVTKSMSLLEKW